MTALALSTSELGSVQGADEPVQTPSELHSRSKPLSRVAFSAFATSLEVIAAHSPLTTTTEMMVQEVEVWPMGSPWIDEEAVRKAPRVYK